jgi:8-oxoguanine deaminase
VTDSREASMDRQATAHEAPMDRQAAPAHEASRDRQAAPAHEGSNVSRRNFIATSLGLVAAAGANSMLEVGAEKQSAQHKLARPKSMLVKNASVLVTMDKARREIKDAGMYIEDGEIKQVGPSSTLPKTAEKILDLKDHLVLPGIVNTHHHLFQHLTRVAPAAQNCSLKDWKKNLLPMWQRITPEDLRLCVQIALAELVLSGCTTVFDQQYLFPNGCTLDDSILVAKEMGVRFNPSRGFTSGSRSLAGDAPNNGFENESKILSDCQRLIDKYHDLTAGAMTRIAIAPDSISTVNRELFIESAKLARRNKCRLHTVIAETNEEIQFALKQYKLRSIEFLESLDWLGNDVFLAHAIHITDADIAKLARTGTSIAHCPSSNFRLASGIAPVLKLRNAGVKVGIAVDGASSNDSGNALAEIRMALIAARALVAVSQGETASDNAAWLSARDCLEMATIDGATILGRDDIGSLEPGKRADFFSVNINQVSMAGGSVVDPVASLAFCTPHNAAYTVIDGRVIVSDGQIQTLDLPIAIEKLNKASRRIIA